MNSKTSSLVLTATLLLPVMGVAQEASLQRPPVPESRPSADAPKPVVKAPVFAAASAEKAKRMPAEQKAERGFLRSATASSRFVLEASSLAISKSTNAGVRAYATRLNASYRTASQQLQHMMQARGMALPMLENSHRKALNGLAKLGGAKFDREFMAQLGTRYQTDEVQMFERAQKVVKDPVLAGWIGRSLGATRENLALAEQANHGGAKLTGASFARAARQAAPAAVPGMAISGESRILGGARTSP